MKTRIVHTKIWADSFYSELTPSEKLLFLYYLTNESVNIIHCYECSDRKTSFDTGLDSTAIKKAKERFQKAGKLLFYDNYVRIINASKYESYTGADNEKAKENILKTFGEDVLNWYREGSYTPVTPLSTGEGTGTINHNTEIISHNTEKGESVRGGTSTASPKYLVDIPLEDLSELQLKYQASVGQIKAKAEDLHNYCKAHGKQYRDYKAVLLNALNRDFGKRTKPLQGKSDYVLDPTTKTYKIVTSVPNPT